MTLGLVNGSMNFHLKVTDSNLRSVVTEIFYHHLMGCFDAYLK